jgi:hypothetical protein
MKAPVIALPLLILSTPALAQELTRTELLDELKQRDQAIAELQKRVAALEAEKQSSAPVATAPPPAPSTPVAAATGQANTDIASANTQDDVALQALSRTLVQRGALVLPKWVVESSPQIGYSHTQTQGLALVDSPDGVSTVDSRRQRDDSIAWSESVRVGLPWESQLQVQVPWSWNRESFALGDGSHATTDQLGLGDVSVELSRQMLREHGWLPDLVAAASWTFPTGTDPFKNVVSSVATGTGTNQVKGRLTALKSSDPLVFFSTVSYNYSLPVHEKFGNVRPGDVWTWEVGTVIAANPQTSLTVGFSQQFRGQTHLDGAPIAGSDGVAGVLEFGLGRVLSPSALLDFSLGVGVTRDAPDYQFQISLPIRFR